MSDFASFSLDARLLKSLAKMGIEVPSMVQAAAIPKILEGKDVIAQAETGSGKTAAFSVPVIQRILTEGRSEKLQAIILVPTGELTKQVEAHVSKLCKYCSEEVKVVALSAGAGSNKTQKRLLREKPSILVCTPARLALHLRNGAVELADVSMVVMDEADLMLNYGYEEDVKSIVAELPDVRQVVLMSATLGTKVEELKELLQFATEPLVIEVAAAGKGDDKLRQFSIACRTETDKFLVTYVMLRLRLISGKSLIFVNTVEQGFRLKLFLDQFYLKAVLLNAELPQNSRLHVLKEFNSGMHDILIATDENQLILDSEAATLKAQEELDMLQAQRQEAGEEEEEPQQPEGKKKSSKRKRKFDAEFGVARGFDFRAVSNVLNFDVPLDSDTYVHRIGRTARAGAKGNAISLSVTERDRAVLAAEQEGGVVRPFSFKMDVVEGFRYRVEDVLRSKITKRVIRDERLAEIKREMLTSEKLKSHFEDNPGDLAVLQNDKQAYHKKRKQPELKHVPDYLEPKAMDAAEMSRQLLADDGKGKKARAKRPHEEEDPLRTLRSKKMRRANRRRTGKTGKRGRGKKN